MKHTNTSTANTSLSNTTQKANKKKGQHKKRFEKRDDFERSWAVGITWKKLPDIISHCPNLSPNLKVVYWYLWTLLPCCPTLSSITATQGLRRSTVMKVLKELIARKIIFIKEQGRGARATLYGMNMEPAEWDLEKKPKGLYGPIKKIETEKLQFHCGTTKIICSSTVELQITNSSSTVELQNTNCSSTVELQNGHYYHSKLRMDDSPNTESIKTKSAPPPVMGGGLPRKEQKQRELPLKTLHHGGLSKEEIDRRNKESQQAMDYLQKFAHEQD